MCSAIVQLITACLIIAFVCTFPSELQNSYAYGKKCQETCIARDFISLQSEIHVFRHLTIGILSEKGLVKMSNAK